MSLLGGFASLSSQTLQFLQSTVESTRIVHSVLPAQWTGVAVIHLESASSWSPAFECFLLDRGLPLDLHSACREPSKSSKIQVLLSSPPLWHFFEGCQFGCIANLTLVDDVPTATISKPNDIWPIGVFRQEAGTNFVHLFSGGFGGWSQAHNWLASHGQIPQPHSTICVDADFRACYLTEKTFGYQMIYPGNQFEGCGRNLIINCLVDDPFWLQFVQAGCNLLVTISFPCQPFSTGGRKQGIDHHDGKAVIHAAQKVRLLQPIAVALENVAGFHRHCHAALVIRFFKWAGYTLQWQQSHELGSISAGQRERWLAVLIRHDINPLCSIGILSFTMFDKPSWNDALYEFALHPSIEEQLHIGEDLFSIYAAKEFLPKAKRDRHSLGDDPNQVLKARCPLPSDQLATLVASYTSQHHLSKQHIRYAGIFAELKLRSDGTFAFFDPPKWASLLGCTSTLFIPRDVSEAFGVLGNAIATPQAAMAILCMVNLAGIVSAPISIVATVLRLWADRMTAKSSIFVPVDDDLCVLIGPNDFLMLGPIERLSSSPEDEAQLTWTFLWPDGSDSVVQIFHGEFAKEIMIRIGIPDFVVSLWAIQLIQSKKLIFHDMRIESAHQIVQLVFIPLQPSAPQVVMNIVSPTLPWTDPIDIDETVRDASQETVNHLDDFNFLVPIKIFTPKGQVIEVEMFDQRTIREAIGIVDPDVHQDFSISVDGKDVDPDTTLASLSKFEIVVNNPLKRKKVPAEHAMLEIINLSGNTTFVPTHHSQSIREALVSASFAEQLIRHLVPESNGRRVHLDDRIDALPSPHIRLRAFPLKGGGKGGGKQQTDILMTDPWATFKPTTASGSNAMGGSARWDQLELPPNHPWFVKGGDRISQVKVLQLGPQVGGVAFATKNAIQQHLHFQPTKPTLLLLPGLKEGTKYDEQFASKLLPPQQIVVQEPSGKQYKRIVVPMVMQGDFEFKMTDHPKAVSVTTSNFAELVIELHSSVANPQALEQIKDHPLEFFRKHVASLQVPIKEMSIYSYRVVKSQEHAIHQALMKVPETIRKTLLTSSGIKDVFVRQFIHNGDSTDHSVLQRFWQINHQEVRQALSLGDALGSDIFFGLALTPKGIAIRCANAMIGQARASVMQDDVRFTDLNRNVVVRHYFLAQGFSFDMSHNSVIEAVHQATKLASVPLRSFKLAGLLTWVLGFQEEPKVCQFVVEVGGIPHEILLSRQEDNKPNKKTIRKQKQQKENKQKNSWKPETIQFRQSPTDHSTENRLQALEGKVAGLETQQTNLSNKVDRHYDDISDQLRKVLAAVTTTRVRDPTNETPPPKIQKSS